MTDCVRWPYLMCECQHVHGCDRTCDEWTQLYPIAIEDGWEGCGVLGACLNVEQCWCSNQCEYACHCKNETFPDDPQRTFYRDYTCESPEIVRLLEQGCGLGACCKYNAHYCVSDCQDRTEANCLNTGGVWHRAHRCDVDDPCGVGICCFCGWKCEVMDSDMCVLMGGIPGDRPGLSCSDEGFCSAYMRTKVTSCRAEPFGPAQRIPEHLPPQGMEYRENTWELASRKGIFMSPEGQWQIPPLDDDSQRRQHYGKVGVSDTGHALGYVCSHWERQPGDITWYANELNECPVAVQTKEDILSEFSIPEGYAAFACGFRCSCRFDPCRN